MNKKNLFILTLLFCFNCLADQTQKATTTAPELDPPVANLKELCANDVQKNCKYVEGFSKIRLCLLENKERVSKPCLDGFQVLDANFKSYNDIILKSCRSLIAKRCTKKEMESTGDKSVFGTCLRKIPQNQWTGKCFESFKKYYNL